MLLPAPAPLTPMTNDAKRFRVILVDDHPTVLRQTLQLLPERFEVVATLQEGLDLPTEAHDLQPDLIVLDITLPAVDGVQLARQLRADGCKARIIFLTVHADPDYAWEAFNSGALGYVIKPR